MCFEVIMLCTYYGMLSYIGWIVVMVILVWNYFLRYEKKLMGNIMIMEYLKKIMFPLDLENRKWIELNGIGSNCYGI
jgi:hypothetical protein